MEALERIKGVLTERQYKMFNDWITEKPVKLWASGGMRARQNICFSINVSSNDSA